MADKMYFQFNGSTSMMQLLRLAPYECSATNNRAIVAVMSSEPGDEVPRLRYRPTGENDDGPYFNSYNGGKDGVSFGLVDSSIIYAESGCGHYETGGEDSNLYPAHDQYWWEMHPKAQTIKIFKYLDMKRKVYTTKETVKAIFIKYDRRTLLHKSGSTYQLRCKVATYEFACPWGGERGLAYHRTMFDEEVDRALKAPWSTQLVSLLTGKETYRGPQVFDFRHNEENAFLGITEFDIYPPLYSSLASAAYVDACEQLPQTATNSIANVIELASSINNLRKGKLIPTNIKDAWLAYRYAYCTTKSDIGEYQELTDRLVKLAGSASIISHGQCVGDGVKCCCTIKCNASDVIPQDTLQWLRTYGFRLNAVNAWDMVPYSFVVDWFLHISDFLEYFQNLGDALSLPVEEIWYSYSTEYDNQSTYFRVPGKVLFQLPYVSYKSASKKTIFKRILDSIALFL